MKLRKGVKDMMAEAASRVETISAQQALALSSSDVAIIDIRDAGELKKEGRIPHSAHVPRGMLEFAADPNMPYHNPVFSSGKKLVLHCASGGRSALAVMTLQDMGFDNVCHIGGGFGAWVEAGGEVDKPLESSD